MRLPVVNLLANLLLAVLPHVLRKQHDAITTQAYGGSEIKGEGGITSGTASGAPSQSSLPVEICARARSSNETREHFLS